MVVLLCVQAGYAAISWDYEYMCAEYPEAFQSGTVLGYTPYGAIDRTLDVDVDGQGTNRLTFQANPGSEGFVMQTTSSAWQEADSTIEFTYRTYGYRDSKDKVVHVVIDNSAGHRTGFLFAQLSGTPHIQDIASSTNRATFLHYNENTYRMLYYATGPEAGKADLYYKDGSSWEYLLTANGYNPGINVDRMEIGDPSSSYAGYYYFSKVLWTNQGATLGQIVPEPGSLALISLGGAWLLRRHRMKT